MLDWVPITVPSRIPFDLAATQPWLAAKALDRAWAANLLTYTSSTLMLDDLAERGRKGITLMRELLAERGPDYRPNDTNLEDRFQELAREAGFYDLERQRNLLDREWLGRVDFVSAERMLVIEVDSAFCHGALVDEADDLVRTEALTLPATASSGSRTTRSGSTRTAPSPASAPSVLAPDPPVIGGGSEARTNSLSFWPLICRS